MTAEPAGARWPAAQSPAPPSPARLAWRTVISGAFLVTLARPLSWAVGLAGFLAGGGLLIMTWPILVLPTPTGLQNALGGPVSSLVFGTPSMVLVALLAGALLGGLGLLIAGVGIGAWAERQGIDIALEAAVDEGILGEVPDPERAPGWGHVSLLRLLSLVPVAVAMTLALRPVYEVAYRELTLPGDLVTPLPVRVLVQLPLPVVGVWVTWLLSDAAAAVGVRRLVIERRSVAAAWLLGWADLVRRPHRVIPTALTGIAVTLLLVAPGLAAATLGWARVRAVVLDGRDPLTVLIAVMLWVAVWLGALVLAGVGAGFRNAAWTLELPRTRETSPR